MRLRLIEYLAVTVSAAAMSALCSMSYLSAATVERLPTTLELAAAMKLLAAALKGLWSAATMELLHAWGLMNRAAPKSFAPAEPFMEFATEAPAKAATKTMIIAVKSARPTPVTGIPTSAEEAWPDPKRTRIGRQSPVAGNELAIRIVVAVNPDVAGSWSRRPRYIACLRIRSLWIGLLRIALLRITLLREPGLRVRSLLIVTTLRWVIVRVPAIGWVLLLSQQRHSRHRHQRHQFRFHNLFFASRRGLQMHAARQEINY